MDYSYIDKNTARIRAELEAAAREAGREPDGVTLLAAVKYAEAGEIDHLCHNCGVTDIGENRVQQLLEHWEAIDREGVRFHFIGSLQTNKVKYIADKVCMIHSVDSEKLAAEIDKRSRAADRVMDILVEINSGREENKSGVLPEEAAELCEKLAKYPNIRLCGFMTMAPRCESSDEYRKYFSETYNLIVDIWEKKLHNIKRPIISMGMSESFHEAVAEGSTCVRVGRAFFAK